MVLRTSPSHIRPSARAARPASLLLAAAALAAAASPLHATTINSTWTGTSSPNWSAPANWSPSTAFPNNGNAGVSDYNVTINPVATNAPILDTSPTIDSLALTTNASLLMNSGQTLTLATNSFTNAGTLTLLGNGSFGSATLSFAPGVTSISGGGTILLSDSSFSRLSGGNITNVDNTIQGAGIVSQSIINQATLRAQGGNLTLNGTVDNTVGLVDITVNGTLNVGNSITGGTISVATGGQLLGAGTLLNTTLTAPSNLTIVSGSSTPSFAGSFVNHGNINIAGNGTFGAATLTFSNIGTTALSGGGTITLSDGSFSHILSNFTNIDNTLQGAGIISSAFSNQFIVRAQAGNLTLNNTVDNSGGTLAATANGTLVVNSSVTGGTIALASGSQLLGSGTLVNVTLSPGSLWSIPSGASSPTLSNTFTNHANISILGNGTLGTAAILLPTSGAVTLNGGGTVTLTNASFSRISSGNLINVDNTLQGAGIISASIINQSAINATGGNLTLNGHVDNSNGAMSISATGGLLLGNTVTGGNLSMLAGSLIGGTGTLDNITLSGTGSIIQSPTLSNSTLASAANLSISSGSTLTAVGTILNHGTITILGNGTVGSATLGIDGNTTLAGNGTVLLSNVSFSHISNGQLTNADNIIRGAGSINTVITNNASILAENGNLTLSAPVANALGTLIASPTGALLVNAPVTGGTLLVNAGGQVVGSGSLTSVTLDPASNWTLLAGTSSPILTTSFTNQANITILGNGTLGSATLTFAASPVTLNGGGTITLSNATFSRISGTTGSSITNLDNTIQGAGIISPPINNQGHLIASGGNLTFNADVSGTGTASVLSGAAMIVANFTQSSLANNGNFTMSGNGSLSQISGAGTLTLNSAHLLLPANSPTFRQGDLTASGLASLDIANNKFILDPATKSTTLARIQSEITTNNIISSTLPPNFGIAIADNAVTQFTTFGGQSVGPGSLLLSQELLGDANLDGHIDLTDLSTVLNNFGSTTPNWTSGNFDHAPTIDLTDLSDVLNNFGASNPNASVSAFSLQTAFPTPTPEPASIALLLPLLLRPRRRIKA